MGTGSSIPGPDVHEHDLLFLAGEDYSGRRRDAAEASVPADPSEDLVAAERICTGERNPWGYRALYRRTGVRDKKWSDGCPASCTTGLRRDPKGRIKQYKSGTEKEGIEEETIKNDNLKENKEKEVSKYWETFENKGEDNIENKNLIKHREKKVKNEKKSDKNKKVTKKNINNKGGIKEKNTIEVKKSRIKSAKVEYSTKLKKDSNKEETEFVSKKNTINKDSVQNEKTKIKKHGKLKKKHITEEKDQNINSENI